MTRRQPRAILTLALAALVAVGTAGCIPTAVPDDELARPVALVVNPDSPLGMPRLIGYDTYIQDETLVLEARDLDQLSVLLLNGDVCLIPGDERPLCQYILTFVNPPSGIEVGSVLVADVSPSTPVGLLATATSIEGVVVHATEAGLADAIKQGEFLMEQQFTAADVRSQVLAPGVVSRDPGIQPQAFGGSARTGVSMSPSLGGNFGFNYAIDSEIVAGVRAVGNVGLDLGCGAYGGLTWKKVWGVPVYPNGVYFEAKCSATQDGALTLVGSAGISVEKSVQVAQINLSPITFFIGPVPVVLVPVIDISVDAKGKLSAEMSVGASEHFGAVVGINYSGGIHVIKDFSSGFDKQVSTGSARLSLEAGLSVTESVLLYGIVGPALTETLYLRLEGKPKPEAPVWCLTGGLKGSAGLHIDLGVKEIHWGPEQVFDEGTELGCAPDQAPELSLNLPRLNVFPGTSSSPAQFAGKGEDPEDGALPITWSSDRDGSLGTTKPGETLTVAKLSLGNHVITGTVTDSKGHVTSKTTAVTAVDGSPVVSFEVRDAVGNFTPGSSLSGLQGDTLYIRALMASPLPLSLGTGCFGSTATWQSTLPVKTLGDCTYSIELTQQGQFSIAFTFVDDSLSGAGTVTVNVGPKPQYPKPVLTPIAASTMSGDAVGNNSVVPANTQIVMVVNSNSTAANVPVRYDWTVQTVTNGAAAAPVAFSGSGDSAVGSARVFQTQPESMSSRTYIVTVNWFSTATNTVVATSKISYSVLVAVH